MLSDPAADGVIRNQLPDDTLLVFLSDTHIGGPAGSDIFESAAELTLLIEDSTVTTDPSSSWSPGISSTCCA